MKKNNNKNIHATMENVTQHWRHTTLVTKEKKIRGNFYFQKASLVRFSDSLLLIKIPAQGREFLWMNFISLNFYDEMQTKSLPDVFKLKSGFLDISVPILKSLFILLTYKKKFILSLGWSRNVFISHFQFAWNFSSFFSEFCNLLRNGKKILMEVRSFV